MAQRGASPSRIPLAPSRPAERPSPGAAAPRDPQLARLEAVLFLAREPLASRRLARMAGLADGTEARTLVRRLNRCYDESGSAFRAEEVAGGFQLLTRPAFGPWLRRLRGSNIETRLSGPALETLTVIAYRQPALRAQIEAIRGVDCGEILRQLLERDLVKISGRSEELGRPYYYSTTRRFLQVFGMRHLDDLPRAEILRPSHRPGMGATDSMRDEKSSGGASAPTDQPVIRDIEVEDEEELASDHYPTE